MFIKVGDHLMCLCKKRKLSNRVIQSVKTSEEIDINKVSPVSHGRTSESNQGIYFLYNNSKEIIYVGKIGIGNGTSLYDRCIKGHREPHITKSWGSEISSVKFHKFDRLTEVELEQIESLVICRLNPIYNNATISSTDIKTILSKI